MANKEFHAYPHNISFTPVPEPDPDTGLFSWIRWTFLSDPLHCCWEVYFYIKLKPDKRKLFLPLTYEFSTSSGFKCQKNIFFSIKGKVCDMSSLSWKLHICASNLHKIWNLVKRMLKFFVLPDGSFRGILTVLAEKKTVSPKEDFGLKIGPNVFNFM